MDIHLIQSWVLPPGVNILFWIIGFILCFFSRVTGNIIMILSILTLWLFSSPFVAYNMIDLLQEKYTMLNTKSLQKGQKNIAIVVLGGGDTVRAEYGNKRTVSDFTQHRLEYAVYLHRITHFPIIVSGGRFLRGTPSEADLMTDVLRDSYRLTTQFKEDRSLTTADESKYLVPILKSNKFDIIYLVTNAWHMPRSVFIFQCAGIKVIPAPMGYFMYGPGYALISFIPNIEALRASSLAIHEFIGLIWYHFNYEKRCIYSVT